MKKYTKNSGFSKEFINEAKKQGGFKTLAGAVGMPDEKDWENIVLIVAAYRKESIKRYGKDILVEAVADARKEHEAAGNKYGRMTEEFKLVNKDSNMRHIFELPESFVRIIEQAYPLMFTDKDHFAWFARNFAQLRISDKY